MWTAFRVSNLLLNTILTQKNIIPKHKISTQYTKISQIYKFQNVFETFHANALLQLQLIKSHQNTNKQTMLTCQIFIHKYNKSIQLKTKILINYTY